MLFYCLLAFFWLRFVVCVSMLGLVVCFRLHWFVVCSFNSVVVFMMFLVGVLWWFVFVFSGCCGYLWFVFVCLLLVVYGASWGVVGFACCGWYACVLGVL